MSIKKSFLISSLIIASPVLAAFLSSIFSGGHIFDENSSGAYLWLLFLSIPAGVLFFIIAVIIRVIRR